MTRWERGSCRLCAGQWREGLAQVFDEFGCVMALVGTRRNTGCGSRLRHFADHDFGCFALGPGFDQDAVHAEVFLRQPVVLIGRDEVFEFFEGEQAFGECVGAAHGVDALLDWVGGVFRQPVKRKRIVLSKK